VATHRSPTAPRIALAALSAAAAIGLVRVFAGAGWLVPAVVAAIAPHALFALAERRRVSPPFALFATAVIGFAFTMVVVAPDTTAYGLPTLSTLRAFGDDLGLASSTLRTAVVPVQPIDAALALALVSIWFVATVADWLAARLDASLGALGPSLVLFVAVAALGEGAHWPTTFLYGVAAAGFLLAEHQGELLERRTWFHLPRRRRSQFVTGGAMTGVLAIAVALVVGPLLPGARSEAWFDYRNLGDRGGGGTWRTVTPLVDIRTRLIDQSDDELFTVEAARGEYWRMVALDTFNGDVWGTEREAPRVGTDVPSSGPQPPSVELVQEFAIGPLDSRWLPAAFRPVRIELEDARVIEESASLVSDDASSNDARYSVVSRIPTPSRTQLAATLPASRSEMAEYLELPDDFSDYVSDLADNVVAGASSPYEQALALQTFLRDESLFEYSTDVEPGHSDDALEEFLRDTRRGYCEQFAGSYAAMARSVGLPARVAVGFTPGNRDENGVFHVTNKEAHAWPEVWFDGIGWMPFEPTPGRFQPSPGDPTGTGDEAPPSSTGTTATSAPSTSSTTAAGVTPTFPRNRLGDEFVNAGGASLDEADDGVGSRVLLALGVIVAVVVLAVAGTLLTVLTVKWSRRRRRRHAPDVRDRVTGAWAEALDRLSEAGVAPRASATPVEFALRHAPAAGAGPAGPPLMTLARLQTAALFARESPSPDQAAEAWRQVHQIERALRHATRWSRRWRRRLDPRSLRVAGPGPA
jgi:transglutaminase-like putative cysteine protease